MYKNKKGFTLVELIAVIVVLILLMVMAISMANKHMETTKINAFIKEANTFAKGAMTKEGFDRELEKYSDDIFYNAVYGKVCYSITNKSLSKFVEKTKNNYKGSVEVCYGLDCTYTTKIWITDGKHYIDGLTDPSKTEQVTSSFSTQYPESCGYETAGIGGSSGNTLISNFDFTGGEQMFIANKNGVYALETWGAGGGDYDLTRLGGKGSYSYVEVELNKGDMLYVNVGGKGAGPCAVNDSSCKATYNGGAKGALYIAAGGGATHIAIKSGQLFDVSGEYVLIASGGGGGGHPATNAERANLVNAGGYCNTYWPNARGCGTYGFHGGYRQTTENYYGNGGGFSSADNGSHTFAHNDFYYLDVLGGTGYVTNRLVKNGRMACYSCNSSDRTTVVPNYSDQPITDYAKIENGYARITYIGDYTM
ncbi:MAG: prepilin-type N-terminal cleavage/methylation domain-containing protein [Bacilli bacterium]|nr:prepilin-type N-terminal cleavage/methylation domain-containing protein [Bacilli bacterium]